MLKSIAQEYFNSILNDMFDVNNFYITSSEHINVQDIFIDLGDQGDFFLLVFTFYYWR